MEIPLDRWRRMERTMNGVDWRRQLAVKHIQQGRTRVTPEYDAATRHAIDFIRLGAKSQDGKAEAQHKYPDVALAEAAWNQPALRSAIQLLVVANIAPAEICEMLNLEPTVLQIIEDLYFDTRPMLALTSWVVANVIVPEGDAGRDDVAAQLRMAYFGGPYVARAIVEATKLRLPIEQTEQLADAAMLLHAKFVQAMEMPLNAEQSVEFVRLTAEIRRDEQLIKLERDKLAFRMQRWTQRYALAQARRPAVTEDPTHAIDGEAAAGATS